MKLLLVSIVAAILVLSAGAYAQTQAPTVTATCKDGTSFSGTSKNGACQGHGGVKKWGSTAAAATGGVTSAQTVTATCKDGTSFSGTSKKGACQGHGGVKKWGSTAAAATGASTSPTTAAPGGGKGQVWVYETATAKVLSKLECEFSAIYTLAYSPDGKQIASAGFDGMVRLSDPTNGKVTKEFVGVPLATATSDAKHQ